MIYIQTDDGVIQPLVKDTSIDLLNLQKIDELTQIGSISEAQAEELITNPCVKDVSAKLKSNEVK